MAVRQSHWWMEKGKKYFSYFPPFKNGKWLRFCLIFLFCFLKLHISHSWKHVIMICMTCNSISLHLDLFSLACVVLYGMCVFEKWLNKLPVDKMLDFLSFLWKISCSYRQDYSNIKSSHQGGKEKRKKENNVKTQKPCEKPSQTWEFLPNSKIDLVWCATPKARLQIALESLVLWLVFLFWVFSNELDTVCWSKSCEIR